MSKKPMARVRRPGLTQIELLVVIAIIAILLALLVTAVQRAREAAARIQCQNNLSQLAIAVHSYHSDYKTFPQYASGHAGEIYGSWFVHLLPYLDNGSIYAQIFDCDLRSHPSPGLGIGIFRNFRFPYLYCPADPSASSNAYNVGTTNYLANWYTFTQGNRGVYSDPRRLGDLTDGPSNVVLFAEAYSVCGKFYRVSLDSALFHNFGVTPSGKPSDDPSYVPDDFRMFQVQPRADVCNYWRTQTPHTVMQVALADGSVRAVSGAVSHETWYRALNPTDGLPLGDDW